MSTNNPFDFTKVFQQFDPAEVAQKIQDTFKFDSSVFNFDAVKSVQEKNIALLTSSNQAVADSSQALVKRQAEMLQEAMTEATNAAKSLVGSGSPQEVAEKQAELLQTAYEKTLANSTEITEMVQKTQEEVSEKVNKRIAESMEELKEAISKVA